MQEPLGPADEPSKLPDLDAPDLSDWRSMRLHFQPHPGMLDALTQVARATLPEVLERLRQALADDATAELGTIAHEIKGSALNLRAQHLADLAAKTQDQARAGDDRSRATGQALAAHLARFIDRLAEVEPPRGNQ